MTDESDDGVTIDDVKKVSEIGPIKALLTPSAEILGQRMKSSLESWFDKRAAKNIEEHASRVLPKDRQLEASEQSQIDLFDWAEKAGRVSSSEPELSASIQAALRATLMGERDDAEILKNLTKSEILFLLYPNFKDHGSHAMKTLEQKALVERTAMFSSNRSSRQRSTETEFAAKSMMLIVIMIGSWGIFSYLMPALTGQSSFFPDVSETYQTAISLLAPILVGVSFGLFLFLPWHYQFTRKGGDIRKQVQAHLRERK